MTRLILLLLGVAHLVTLRAFISRSAAQDGQDDRNTLWQPAPLRNFSI